MAEVKTGAEIVADFFAAFERRDLDAVQEFFAPDATYIVVGDPDGSPALDPESRAAIPWIGRYRGPSGARAFIGHLQHNIEVIGFGPQDVIAGDEKDGGEKIAVFGSFSYRSVATGRQFDSDYAIRIVLRDGKFTEYTFFENTYAVAAAFRKEGSWTLEHNGMTKRIP